VMAGQDAFFSAEATLARPQRTLRVVPAPDALQETALRSRA
jgi:hypothetical protein